MSTRVFISWSGDRSRRLATALRDWLQDVNNFLDPWMSEEDIRKGSHWPAVLGTELEKADLGILVVTPENQSEPWLLFEAGALAKRFGTGPSVCVYLLGLNPGQLTAGPLTHYQNTVAEEEDTFRLVSTLNGACGDEALTPERLRRSFNRCWIELHQKISELQHEGPPQAQTERSDREVLEEVLVSVRDLVRAVSTSREVPWQGSPLTERFLRRIREERPALRAHLEGQSIEVSKRHVRVRVRESDHLLRDALERHSELLNAIVLEVFGPDYVFLLQGIPD